MNKNKLVAWIIIFGFMTFGAAVVKAQKSPVKKIESWKIYSSAFISLREGGRSFSLDSQGNLEKQSKTGKTTETMEAANLQEIGKLLGELNLPGTKTKTVKGKRIHDFPYWNFTIELDGQSFLMEGFLFNDAKFLVLTEKQMKTFAKLKELLNKIGAVR